jgi:hypothetical protein
MFSYAANALKCGRSVKTIETALLVAFLQENCFNKSCSFVRNTQHGGYRMFENTQCPFCGGVGQRTVPIPDSTDHPWREEPIFTKCTHCDGTGKIREDNESSSELSDDPQNRKSENRKNG